MDPNKAVPDGGQPPTGQTDNQQTVPPSTTPVSTEGQTQTPPAGQPVTPQALQGKSQDDLVKMYGELERKLGEQGNELGNARKFQQEMGLVLQAIHGDPDTKERVEKQLNKVLGVEEKPKDDKGKTQPTSERRVLENMVIRKFEEDHGLTTLDQEQKSKAYEGITKELAAIVNTVSPGSGNDLGGVLDKIDLNELPSLLDRAYRLADSDGAVRKAAEEGKLRAQAEAAGMIGSIPSSNSVSGSRVLTPEERETARKLGISEEDYLKNKD